MDVNLVSYYVQALNRSGPKGRLLMDFTEAFLRVEQERDYLIDCLRKIIGVDTSIPPGENYGELVNILEVELNGFGFETQRVAVPEEKYRLIPEPLSGERINLVGVLKNGKPQHLLRAHGRGAG